MSSSINTPPSLGVGDIVRVIITFTGISLPFYGEIEELDMGEQTNSVVRFIPLINFPPQLESNENLPHPWTGKRGDVLYLCCPRCLSRTPNQGLALKFMEYYHQDDRGQMQLKIFKYHPSCPYRYHKEVL